MKRWGQLKADVDYAKVAAEVYLATDTAGMMKEMGLTPPDPAKKSIVVMGKAFDPAQPDAYVSSFAIRRS
jgi:nitrate/nitrite transport system substrate-binding protein